MSLGGSDGGQSVASGFDRVALVFEDALHHGAQVVVIVHDEQSRLFLKA